MHTQTRAPTHHRWQDDPAQQGSIVGTPYYLAPECWRGDCSDLDLADVWALGPCHQLNTVCHELNDMCHELIDIVCWRVTALADV